MPRVLWESFKDPWVSLGDVSLVNIGLGDSWDALVHLWGCSSGSPRVLWESFKDPWVSLGDVSLVNIGLGDSWDALVHLWGCSSGSPRVLCESFKDLWVSLGVFGRFLGCFDSSLGVL